MKDIKDIIEFYKAGDITDKSLENEIVRAFSGLSAFDVVVDRSTIIGNTTATYVGMVIPEIKNGVAKTTLALDGNLMYNKLSVNEILEIIEIGERLIPWTIKVLSDFIRKHKGSEVSLLECIEAYVSIYLGYYNILKDHPSLRELIISKSVDGEKLEDLQIALHEKTENQNSVIEFINVHKLIPGLAVEKAKELFTTLNTGKTGSEDIGADVPLVNYQYNKMQALCPNSMKICEPKDDPEEFLRRD